MIKNPLLILGFALAALTATVVRAGPFSPLTGVVERSAMVPADQADHEEGAERDGVVAMSNAERTEHGVQVAVAGRRTLYEEAVVPGEVIHDLYRSAEVTPRIAVQVVARHARLGERVKKGQRLVTLSSVEMAEAQGALIVAAREWARVRKLGREVVSEQRYVEAKVAAERARATVLAFGMTPSEADALVRDRDVSRATGLFDLLAPQDGTIIADDFVLGEVVEPGRVLFRIADERRVWVEAKLSPDQAARVLIGHRVRIETGRGYPLSGEVIQLHHVLDETTRTLGVRVLVDNRADTLHPGEFVRVALHMGDGRPVLAVPEEAVTLMKGVPTVFLLKGDAFQPTPVKIGERRAGWVEIRDGFDEGEKIAVKRVFLLKSLILKSEMGEGHGH